MSDSYKIEKVAVLGTGVMGAQIAAHLTNAKIPVLAFDISQEIAEKGVEASTKLKPSAYYNPKTVEMITPLNYDDHVVLQKDITALFTWSNVNKMKFHPNKCKILSLNYKRPQKMKTFSYKTNDKEI